MYSESGSSYRFGFNGMLRDDDAKDLTSTDPLPNEGVGNSYATQFRMYDPRTTRWFSLDPLRAQFPWTSPYVGMGNNPVSFIDIKGDSVSLIISGATFSSDNNKSNQNSLGGHVALNIDGKVYSFEGDGQWHIRDYNEYVEFEKENRGVAELTINVDQKIVQNALDSKVHNKEGEKYDVEKNSCVSNILDVLKSAGIPLNETNGAVLPEQVYNDFKNSKFVVNQWEKTHFFGKSFVGRTMYSLLRLFHYNPLDKKVNTIPLLRKNEIKKKQTEKKGTN